MFLEERDRKRIEAGFVQLVIGCITAEGGCRPIHFEFDINFCESIFRMDLKGDQVVVEFKVELEEKDTVWIKFSDLDLSNENDSLLLNWWRNGFRN
jgi:hypothetical protein